MRTLQDVRLNGREFGRDLLAWDALARWLSSQPLPLDLMTLLTEGPAVAVQVEYFLTRIEAARFNGFTPADAVMQVLPEQVPGWLQAADLNNPTIRHWVLGAAAHSAMRDQIRDAIKDGSLTPLDGLTLRPKQAPAAEPVRDVVAAAVPASDDAWKEQARAAARAIVKREAAFDRFPPQSRLADEVATDLRKRGIFGAGGKPLSGTTIKRHALKGISSATKKAKSTTIKRGK